jgi:hypothetical protein
MGICSRLVKANPGIFGGFDNSNPVALFVQMMNNTGGQGSFTAIVPTYEGDNGGHVETSGCENMMIKHASETTTLFIKYCIRLENSSDLVKMTSLSEAW